ncbi:hypothetical protein [Inhella gelatinilytica]|uniref:Uncharacterized protein n=1 Tax=Inhella gelatinilytica TaxID=2795030 RepID=A0A931IRC2_9BURK|nr:hypothetical protein [Inhella gelatinilytica]MBH9551257.1 hypothetical protein [Inhella gelatinilytica]
MVSQILAAIGLTACVGIALYQLKNWLMRRRAKPRRPAPTARPERQEVEWDGNVARPDFRKRRDKRTLH